MKIRSRESWEFELTKLPLRLCVVLALLLLTAGCGQASAAGLGGTVRYAKSGGIAGIDEWMTIGSDGRGRSEKRSFRLTATERAKLGATLRKADLAHAKSPKGEGCCDRFHYSIRYRGHAIEWDDGSRGLPRQITDLWTQLSHLRQKYAD